MTTVADKVTRTATPVQRQAEPASFFQRKEEAGFFGNNKEPSFFPGRIQAKLSVSSPDDPQEKEADAVADKVMRMPEPSVAPVRKEEEKLQRKEEEKEIQPKLNAEPARLYTKGEDGEKEESVQPKIFRSIQRRSEGSGLAPEVEEPESGQERSINRKNISLHHSDTIQCSGRGPPASSIPFGHALSSSKGGGHVLPADTKDFMESRFQADFSGVRIHTGSQAESMNRQVHAQAFTHGNDIYFNSGKYAPATESGKTLLAHELTHTIQQGASSKSPATASRKAATSSSLHISCKKEELTTEDSSLAPGTTLQLSADTSLSNTWLNRSGGAALQVAAREYMEDYYKVSLADIRLHTDSEAMMQCRLAGKDALVNGPHIYMLPWKYDPDSEKGAKLLSEQVAGSLKQRGIKTTGADGNDNSGISGLLSQINAAIQENKKAEISPPVKKQSGPEENPLLKPAKEKGKKDAKPGKEKSKAGKKGKRGRKGAKKDDGPMIRPVQRNPKRSPASPAEDPAFLKVVKKTKTTAKNQQQHEPAEKKSTDAQNNADAVPKEAEGKAQNRKTDGMGEASQVDKPFDAKTFKKDLLKKIEEITPKTLEEATEFKENNKIGDVKGAMGEKVSSEKANTNGPVEKATTQPLQVNEADNKKPVPLPPTDKGARPAALGAKDAVPKKKMEGEISMQEQSQSLDEEMKANNVSEQQLETSKEPSFKEALNEKKKAQQDAVEKPQQYQQEEALALKSAKEEATGTAAQTLTVMHGSRGKNFETTVKHQQTAKQKDEEQRALVTKEVERLYTEAETKVNTALTAADTESATLFDEGAEAARVEFENYVDRKMSEYKRKRYSGFWGGLKWAKDKLFGMPDAVNAFYTDGRQLYIDRMDAVITRVAETVTLRLNEAKQAITEGKKAIDKYVNDLPKNLQEVGKEAATNIQDRFETLEQTVNDKRNDLIDGLAKKYVDNVKKMDERINELKEANKGLVDKAIGFLKKVWKVIKDLVNLFTTILARLASIIGVILDSPSGFFDNLGKAFDRGFTNFKNNFLDYLEKGLMEWLATNLGIPGLELPDKFTPGAILSLVLQVMGFTKQHIKDRAIKLLGERKVKALESAGGLLHRVYTEGLGVLWDMMYEKLTDFKEIIWEAIKSFIKTKIIEAAIMFLMSLLNPIGAFIKLCMAIYDFLMMLVRFKDKIIELLDTILNAVTDVASGAIDGAARAIEKAFAKSIPIIIAFLAALLHLNDIAAKVRSIIMRIQNRVDKVLDWVILKAYKLVGKVVEGALRAEDKVMEGVEKGKDMAIGAGKKAVAAVVGWTKRLLWLEKKFKAEDGSSHRLFFEVKGNQVELMMNPSPKSAYESWVQAIEVDTSTEAGKKKEQKKKKAIEKAKEIDRETTKKITGGEKAEAEQQEKVRGLMDELSELTGHLFANEKPDCSKDGNGLDFDGLRKEYGIGIVAKTLTNIKMPAGSVPSVAHHRSFAIINQRRNQAGSYYVLGHLLNHNLGGTGKDWKNLTPLTREANKQHEHIAEARVKNAVSAGNIVYYKVKAVYGRTVPAAKSKVIQDIMKEEAHVPKKLVCEAEMITPDSLSGTGKKKTIPLVPAGTEIDNNVSQDVKDYDLTGIKRETVYLDCNSVKTLLTIDEVDAWLAPKIKDAWNDKDKVDKTRFSSFDDLANYKFSDGRSFTANQKTTILGLPDLGYVKLYGSS